MIVLDTNVVSELLKPVPAHPVQRWILEQSPLDLFITATTQAELLFGLESMPLGKRRAELHVNVERMFEEGFATRILPFDTQAARAYATLMSGRRSIGKPIGEMDAQIAAVVRVHNSRLATRNVKDFEHCGITLLNPWTQALLH